MKQNFGNGVQSSICIKIRGVLILQLSPDEKKFSRKSLLRQVKIFLLDGGHRYAQVCAIKVVHHSGTLIFRFQTYISNFDRIYFTLKFFNRKFFQTKKSTLILIQIFYNCFFFHMKITSLFFIQIFSS